MLKSGRSRLRVSRTLRGWLVAAVVSALLLAGVPGMAFAATTDPYVAAGGHELDGSFESAPLTAVVVNDSTVTSPVTWLLDDSYVGKDAVAPYEWTVTTATAPGEHKLKARWATGATTTAETVAKFTIVDPGWKAPTTVYEEPAPALQDLWTTADNRRAPIAGVYDWSKAGFGGGTVLPGNANVRSEDACKISASDLATTYGVIPDDGKDDTAGLQQAIDSIKANCSATGDYTKESRLLLPAGVLNVSHELHLDADYLIVRGTGSDPKTGTHLVYKPDANTRYDTLSSDGTRWDPDAMDSGSANGGWLWPGRGLFRVQSRAVAPKYAAEYAAAPANRKDLYEGTVNDHWISGLKLRDKPGDTGFAARKGDKVIYLAADASFDNLKVGGLVDVMAANTMKFYQEMKAVPTSFDLQNLHMRQQTFMVTAGDPLGKTLTLDKPLEYDVPVTSVSDGSDPINGDVFDSVVNPLVDAVVGVGIENLSIAQDEPTLDAAQAKHNYGNMDPAGAMHGIVMKWAANDWVKGVRTDMTGSHPLATENATNISVVDNTFNGSWNKGKGGNGYFRGSRVWDSLYTGNTTRDLRHFTFQWSASGNVAIGNSFDSDLNLHGGYERNNLFELNEVSVPYAHRSANCQTNCGDEGGSAPDDSDWYPIWWAAGQKAVKWSGSSGPNNVFFNNHLRKQLTNDTTPYTDYTRYSDRHKIYRFGVADDGSFHHLDSGGTAITDWAHNETLDYTGGHGVDASKSDPGRSLFLKSISLTGYGGPHPQPLRRTWGCSCWDGRGMVNTRLAADPVNTATGALMESFTDVSLSGLGPNLNWSRTYNSTDPTDGPFGVGWTFAFNASIIPGDGSAPMFREATGAQSLFKKNTDGSYTAQDPGVTSTMTARTGGGWTVRNLDNEELQFDATGHLLSWMDEQGHGVTASYTSGTLTSLKDTLGQTLTITWGTTGAAAGRITKVAGSDGHSASYAYTTAGSAARLTSVIGVDAKTTTYTYDSATGFLNGIVDPTGTTSTATVYDPTTGRVIKQTDAAGGVTTFGWDATTQTATITDPDGVVHQDVYADNVLVSQLDGNGRALDVYYDANNQPIAQNTPDQQLTKAEYDARGNIISQTLASTPDDPDPPQEKWTYDSNNHVTAYTDALGKTTKSEYDAQGRLTKTTAPDGGTTTLTYTALGQVETSTDPLGRVSAYTYSTAGDLTKVVSPTGGITTYTYDAAHNKLTQTDPRGNVAGATAATYTTTWTYDAAGRVLTQSDPLGHVTTNTYDALGQLLTVTAPNAGVTTYTYDGNGNVLTETDAYDHVTTHVYDTAGNETKVTAPDGAVTTSTYDALGQLASQTSPAGNVSGASAEAKRRATVTFAYDEAGRQTQVRKVDPADSTRYLVTTTTYDTTGQPVAVTDPTGATERTEYDIVGRPTRTIDPTGAVTSTTYDDAGRTKTQTGSGATVTNTYNAAGELTKATTGGGSSTSYTYDADGNPLTLVDALGKTTTYTYDVAGNRTKVKDPLGQTSSTLYDAAGQVTKSIDPSTQATVFGHDSMGNVNKVTDPNGGITQYAYDKVGALKTVTTPLNNAYTYTYDKVGRVLTSTTPSGRVTSYAYTPDGKVATLTLPSGTVKYTYDALDQTTTVDYSDSSPDIAITYDQAGRPSRVSNGVATADYTYDPAGRTTGISRGSDQFSYAWNDDGLLTKRTLPGGRSQTYTWGADAQLSDTSLVSGTSTRKVTYGYDADGRLTSTSRDGGLVSARSYDADGQLTQLTHTQGATQLVKQTVAWSPTGNPTTVTTQRGTATATSAVYSYDAAGQITGICRPTSGTTCATGSPSTTYAYDGDGNRTSVVTANTGADKTVTSAFNADDQATTDSVAGAVTTSYTYDPNGNLATQVGASGTRRFSYGVDANLRSLTLEDGRAVSYAYDEQGDRISRAINGTADATWTWDTLDSLPERISEKSGTGDTTHTWWSDPASGLGSSLLDDGTGTGPTTSSAWLLGDYSGSVSDVVTGGALNAAYDYQPFGDLAASSGAGRTANPLRFQGQYQDSVTGLYDLRARDYDAASGRFSGPDPAAPEAGTAFIQTYHYGYNRPTVLGDPSGRCAILCTIAVGAGIGAVVGGVGYGLGHLGSGGDWDWGDFASSVGKGALAGGLIGAGAGLGGAGAEALGLEGWGAWGLEAAGAGLGGVGGGYANSKIYGGGYSWGQAGIDFGTAAGGTVASRAVARYIAALRYARAWRAANDPGPRPSLPTIECPGSARAQSAAAKIRRSGTKSGTVGWKSNIASADVAIDGQGSYVVSSVSGDDVRLGTVPNVGTPGNPVRFIPTATGKNSRVYDTEYKLLNYIANKLGSPSSSVRGKIHLHSERKICPSCNSVISQFEKDFPNVVIKTSIG
jgi:RHS repeat-associated protein